VPKQLNSGAITQALQRAFGFKGRYIPMLDEVIVPVYVIADPSPASQTKLCAATTSVSTDAANFGIIQLFNPLGSGNVVNVTNVVVSSSVKEALNIVFFDGGDAFDQRPNIHFRDRRNPGEPSTVIRREAVVATPVGDLVATVEVDGALSQTASWESQSGDPRQPLAVLPEGTGLAVQQFDELITALFRVNFRFLEIPRTEVNPVGGLP